jgi:glycosyltransferase involved in cell wall biosynthesis
VRICFLTSTYPRHAADGIGSFIRSLAMHLVAAGHEVDVVVGHDPEVAPMEQGGVSVHRFRYPPYHDRYLAGHGRSMEADVRLRPWAPLLMPGFILTGVGRGLALHRRKRFDLVHAHWVVPGGVMGALLSHATGCPLLVSLHGSDARFAMANRLYRSTARMALRRSRYVTACSADLHHSAVTLGADPARTFTVPYGVDVDRFREGDGAGLRARLGLPADAPIIGAMGRLVAKKGLAHLIGAMRHILRQRGDAYCLIGGEGDLMATLRQEIERLGLRERVWLLGRVDWNDAPAFYAACDVVAVPSIVDEGGNQDGLPNVLLEAMACGRAVVASRVAGIPSAVVDGHSGLLVPQQNEQALGEAILALLGDPDLRTSLGHNAQHSMREGFAWPAIAGRMADLYAQAVGEGARGV